MARRQSECDVLIIGAGAAGMMAAVAAAQRSRRVVLLEKNRKVGAKILMSGGTRCNLTHATDARGIAHAFGAQGDFLRSALSAFPPQQVLELFHQEGVDTKVEDTGKVFPVSDRALDVQQALLGLVRRSGVELCAESAATEVRRNDTGAFVVSTPSGDWQAPFLIVTTGGQSYAGCGTTGDGYGWLQQFGHEIVTPRPALVPVLIDADWTKDLRGITLPDVQVRIVEPELDTPGRAESLPKYKPAVETSKRGKRGRSDDAQVRRGSLLFAHFGLSGPVILDISRVISRHPTPKRLQLLCDFLPDAMEQVMIERFQARAREDGKRRIVADLAEELPRRLAEALMVRLDIPLERRYAELTRNERQAIVSMIKSCQFPVRGTLGFEKAEVTAGGVSLDEIDSRDMQSKRVRGLYIAGELLDVDGPIGGYNFQAAFSTGWLAGQRVGT